MSNIKTINLLPEVFRTDTNQKFLNATLDQLVSQPDFTKVNGYIGRHLAPTSKTADSYIPEPTTLRQNYQLEPSVVVRDSNKKTNFFGNYIDLLQQIQYLGGNVTDHSRLFSNESYSYDGLFDYDKFVNFNQYYWLPDGPAQDLANPAPVDVLSTGVPLTETYIVTRDIVTNSYHFSSYGSINNPTLPLARGGTYQFVINQPGVPFWIQTLAGSNGDRGIFGLTNNGTDNGTITFRVPQATAQDNFNTLTTAAQIDFALDVPLRDLWNRSVADITAQYGGFDGVASGLAGRKVIFLSNVNDDTLWIAPGIFDFAPLDTVVYENETSIPLELRGSVWTIRLVGPDDNKVVQFVNPQSIGANEKVFIKAGVNNSNQSYYIDRDFNWSRVPPITADLLTLYYQDSALSQINGQFKLINIESTFIDVQKEILGKTHYISPNGVNFTNGLRIAFDVNVTPASYVDKEFYVEGVGKDIRLVPVDRLVDEWPLDPDYGTFDPTDKDYITVNRSSLDCNVWSRTNRWFHIDVINATADYLGEIPVVNQKSRAVRPIIEFDPDIQLINSGTKFNSIVDILELTAFTHVFRDVEGALANSSSTATVTQYSTTLNLVAGQRIIFGADLDPLVKDKIYQVNIIDLSNDENVHEYRVRLTEVVGSACRAGHVIFARQAITPNQTYGLVDYWFDGTSWKYAQQKTKYNQSPLFDVVDESNISPTDTSRYIKSTFAGTKIFSYEPGTGSNDPYLGFPLSYRNFNNIGDIQFNNNFDNDTITYQTTQYITSQVQQSVNNFYLRQNNYNATDFK